MTGGRPSLTFELDEDDFITSVGPGWDEFALDNGAPQATAVHVIGTLLWRHVHGDNLRHVLRVLYRRARIARCPVVVPFNCNSPMVVRRMRLELHSIDGKSIGVRTFVESESPVGADIPVTTAKAPLHMCSWCNRFELDGTWHAFEDVVGTGNLLRGAEVPDISHTMCPDCCQALERED